MPSGGTSRDLGRSSDPSILYKRFLLQVTKTGLGRSVQPKAGPKRTGPWTQFIKSSTGESNPYHQNGNLRRYHYTSAAFKAILFSLADIAFFSNLDRIKEIDCLKLESSLSAPEWVREADIRQLSKRPRPSSCEGLGFQNHNFFRSSCRPTMSVASPRSQSLIIMTTLLLYIGMLGMAVGLTIILFFGFIKMKLI